ncbi:hypothetical protein B0I33_105314 [Prauserella shujinwangii]|uniref:Uncharacterized protein n=1 Tax=Prauserella shujinwangii TaxID=1453103 RepID=A0A2T0LV58_9PSEU|nr:hypothetical protein [Prauserella shujinwangii]PRX47733.1 hypothetical protein B0I33_105314 [Prauserella shujinwangii]
MASGEIDFLLQSFVEAVNLADDFSIEMTLSVPGGVVSGELVTAQRWMREVAATLETGTSSPSDLIADVYREQAAMYEARRAQHKGYLEGKKPRFLHLRDASWMIAPAPRGQGVFWRGLLGDVGGWSLGRFAAVAA